MASPQQKTNLRVKARKNQKNLERGVRRSEDKKKKHTKRKRRKDEDCTPPLKSRA